MKPEPKELQRWVTPDTSEPRVNRLWARVRATREGRSPARLWLLGSSVAAAAALLLAFVFWPRALPVGAELQSQGVAATTGRFSDGSHVELAAASALRLVSDTPGEVRVELERGAATFEVSKRPSRRFVVLADGVEVRVVGTRFTVARDPRGVQVSVERGIVEVTRDDRTVRLTAGQQWQQTAALAPVPDPELPTAKQTEPAGEGPGGSLEPEPEAEAHGPARPARPPHSRALGAKSAPPAPAPAPTPLTPAVGGAGSDLPARPKGPSAAELFQTALAARRDGRASEAALAFDRFLRDYPHDSRASLAAFELGRLRMDQLGDVRGATVALEQAMELAPDGTFAEDALSRLVRAYDELGSKRACAHYREHYLARFPNGAYAKSVAGRCGQ